MEVQAKKEDVGRQFRQNGEEADLASPRHALSQVGLQFGRANAKSAGHIHRISKLGSSVDDEGERLGDDDDLTVSAEVEMRVDWGQGGGT